MTAAYTIFSKNNKNFDRAVDAYHSMEVDCPYNHPDYMDLLSEYLYTDIQLNIFFLSSENGKVFYPFFKRPLHTIVQIPDLFHTFYDIIGSWYFGGPMADVLTTGSRLLKDFSGAFSQFCEQENIIAEFIRFDPGLQNHLFSDGYHDISVNRETVFIDLAQDYEQIWNRYRGRCRTAIRKALKSGIHISDDADSGRIEAFARIYQSEMERKADSRHYFFPPRFFTDITDTLPDNFKYFFSFHEGRLCGATIVYYSHQIAYDYLMATDIDSWKYQPNNLLLDAAVKWAKSRSIPVFDLMGGRTGVFNFKSSFSDLRRPFFTGKKIHMPEVYSQLVQLTQKLKGDAHNPDFFPVYRQLEG